MKTLRLTFDEGEFRRFKNCKESAKILGEAVSWEDFLLKKCGIRK